MCCVLIQKRGVVIGRAGMTRTIWANYRLKALPP